MLTLFAGDPKIGKSFVTMAMAACVSRGASLPGDEPREAGSVLLLNAEDDPSRTIVPRLKAAGAILEKVHIFESVLLQRNDRNGKPLGDPIEALPCLKSDIDRLAETAKSLGDCRLVIVDPVSAYLGGTDDHKNSELRGTLSPLKAMAGDLNVAIVLVTHLTKTIKTNPLYAVQGSIAYTGAARANSFFVIDKEDETGQRRLMLDGGGNLAPTVPTLAYTIGDIGDGPAVEWCSETVSITAAQYMEQCKEDALKAKHEKTETSECQRWLKETLQEAGGRMLAKEAEAFGKQAGFSRTVLYLAKQRENIRSDREGFGKDSQSFWALPNHAPTPDPAP